MLCGSKSSLLRYDNDSYGDIKPGTECTIVIDKGDKKQGLGLTIIGGKDTPLGAVIIDTIHPNTPASFDKRLRVGDHIIAAYDKYFSTCTHLEALATLKRPRRKVVLRIWRDDQDVKEDDTYDIDTVKLTKTDKGFGLCIVARETGQGVLIQHIVEQSAADINGQLKPGDCLLEINNINVRQDSEEDVTQMFKDNTTVLITYGRLKCVHSLNSPCVSTSSSSYSPSQSTFSYSVSLNTKDSSQAATSKQNSTNAAFTDNNNYNNSDSSTSNSSKIKLIQIVKSHTPSKPKSEKDSLEKKRKSSENKSHESKESVLLEKQPENNRHKELDNVLDNVLIKAGHTTNRVQLQTAIVNYIQQNFMPDNEIICGSLADGWGFNLSRMDGSLHETNNVNLFAVWTNEAHFENCNCNFEKLNVLFKREDKGNYTITSNSNGYTTNTCMSNFIQQKTAVSPFLDVKLAFKCCCKPPTFTLFEREKPTLPQTILDKCQNLPIYLIQTENLQDNFSVSYSLLETEIMHSLPDTLGKCYLFLKYMFTIKLKSIGLNSLIGKHLIFHIFAANNYKNNSVLDLVEKAILLLKMFLITFKTDNQTACMPNFFSDDPITFCPTNNFVNKHYLVEILDTEFNLLADTVNAFIGELKQATNIFYVQPQCLVPTDSMTMSLDVHKILQAFSIDGDTVFALLQELPPSYRIINIVIKALWYLNNNEEDNLQKILNNKLSQHMFFLKPPKTILSENENANLLINYFETEGSIWYMKVHNTNLHLMIDIFHKLRQDEYILINFMAIHNYLRCKHLGGKLGFGECTWFEQMQEQEYLDFQELYAFANIATNESHQKWAIYKLNQLKVTQEEKAMINTLNCWV